MIRIVWLKDHGAHDYYDKGTNHGALLPVIKHVDGSLEGFQRLVDGLIQPADQGAMWPGGLVSREYRAPRGHWVVWCNESGALMNLPINEKVIALCDNMANIGGPMRNPLVPTGTLMGNCFISKVDKFGDPITMSEEEANYWMWMSTPRSLWQAYWRHVANALSKYDVYVFGEMRK